MKHDPDVQARIDAQIVNNLNRPASHSASAFTRAIEAGAVAEAKAAGVAPAGAGDSKLWPTPTAQALALLRYQSWGR